MKIDSSHQVAFSQVVNAFVDYLQLLHLHLENVKQDITGTTEKLMTAVQEVDAKSSEHKEKVEKLMEDVSYNPDEETAKRIQEAQDNVEEIMAAALGETVSEAKTEVEEIEQAQKRRAGGKFSKAVEAVSILEGKLSEVLMKIMASLGIDDIVGQRIVAVTKSTEDLRVNLKGSITEIDKIFNAKIFLDQKRESLKICKKTCRSLEEAELFGQFFTQKDVEASEYPGDPNDEIGIAGEYLKFLAQYTKLVMRYVATVREKIKETLSDATTSVFELSSHTDDSKSHADEMLLGKREDIRTLSEREEKEQKVLAAVSGDEGAKNLLASHLDLPAEMLGEVDSALSEKMMEMIATLSIEDVLGQRLDHINKELANVTRFLSHFCKNPGQNLTPEMALKTKNNLLNFIYNQYSSEEEKRDFERIFGSNTKIA